MTFRFETTPGFHVEIFIKDNLVNFFKKISNSCHDENDYHICNKLFLDYQHIISRFTIKETLSGHESFTKKENILFHNIFKLIGYTRDIKNGLGKRDITYMMITQWYNHYPDSIKTILNDIYTKYGTWADVRLFANYYYRYCNEKKLNFWDNKNLPCIIDYSLDLMIDQLEKDYNEYHSLSNLGNCIISNASKWVPREKNKQFGWLYPFLAKKFNKRVWNSKYKKQRNLFRAFRQELAMLNQYNQTVEIYQCKNNWEMIDFNKVSVTTQKKQNNAFLNINENGERKWNHNIGRDTCAHTYKHYKMNKYIFNTIKQIPSDEELINMIVTTNRNGVLEMRNLNLYEEVNHLWKQNMNCISELNFKYVIPLTDNKSITHDINGGKNSYSHNIRLISMFLRIQEISYLNKVIFVDKYAYDFHEKSLTGKLNLLLKIIQDDSVSVKKYNLHDQSRFIDKYINEKKIPKGRFSFVYLYNNKNGYRWNNKYRHPLPKTVDLDVYPVKYYINFQNSKYIESVLFNSYVQPIEYESLFNNDTYNNNFYNNFKNHFYKYGVICKNYDEYNNFIDTVNRVNYEDLNPFNI